jgi:dienelactone hydrolase
VLAALAGAGALPAQEPPREFTAPSRMLGKDVAFKVDLDAPDRSKPAPAVVLMHGCGGRASKTSSSWREIFAKQGYVTLIVESFAARGWPGSVCREAKFVGLEGQLDRVGEAYGAAKFLATLPVVDPGRIAVMGFSHGAGTVLLTQTPYAKRELGKLGLDFDNPPFKALVANYPNCGRTDDAPVRKGAPRVPLLVQIGAADDWTLADWCQTMVELPNYRTQPGLRFRTYEGAYHSFDSGTRPTTLQACGGPTGRCGTTVHAGHSDPAFAEARKETLAFLQDAFK